MNIFSRLLLVIIFLPLISAAQTTFQRTYESIYPDNGEKIIETKKGTYVVAGYNGVAATTGAYIMEIDCQGNILWSRTLEENFGLQGHGYDVEQTLEGGYILAGRTQSFSQGSSDAFLLKLSSTGTLQWFHTYGTSNYETIEQVVQTSDSGYAAVGTEKTSGDNLFLFKADKNGTLLWSKSIQAGNFENGYSIIERPNGDLITMGLYNQISTSGILSVKSDQNGNIAWIRTYIVTGAGSTAFDVINTNDGGYIACGTINFSGGAGIDYYTAKFDVNDNIQWARSYDIVNDNILERSYAIIQTNDNGYAMAGENYYGLIGNMDYSLIKIDVSGNAQWGYAYGEPAGTNWARSLVQTPDTGYIISGYKTGEAGIVKTNKTGMSGCDEAAFVLTDSVVTPIMSTIGSSSNYGAQNNSAPLINNTLMTVNTECQNLSPITLPLIVTGDTLICSGDSAVLSASIGSSFSWSTGGTSQSITIFPTSIGTYTVDVAYPCYAPATATITVNVINTPSVSISAGSFVICIGDSVTLTANGNGNYLWSNGSTNQSITVSPSSLTSYTITSSNGSCYSSDTITINTLAAPVALITGSNSICNNDSVVLSSSGAAAYQWNTGASTSSITVFPTSNTVYSLTVANGNCMDTTSLLVTVNTLIPGFAGTDTTIALGQSTTLFASGGSSYQWFPTDGLNCISCSNPVASPVISTKYYVIITDANGCISLDSVWVEVTLDCADIFLPNVFSPNDDGQNDVLKIYGSQCIKSMVLIIYDRWGEKIFEISDPNGVWNGTYNGKALNTAVFTYYFKADLFNKKIVEKKGNISLVR